MGRSLDQLRDLQIKYQCPVLIAGDVFDGGWQAHKCPPMLINWVISLLPEKCYAVPGQHDLPHHRYEDVTNSAYWTLVAAGKIVDLAPQFPTEVTTTGGRVLRLHGFPWGSIVGPPQEKGNGLCIEIAVIHQYLWITGKSYTDAPHEQWLGHVKKHLKSYNVCVFGDNHIPFDMVTENTKVCNVGGFMRRRLDEKYHKPSVGLLHSDLTITRHYLDISQDVFDDTPREGKRTSTIDPSELIDELKSLGDKVLDFTESLERLRASGQIEDDVWEIILGALENKK